MYNIKMTWNNVEETVDEQKYVAQCAVANGRTEVYGTNGSLRK